MKKAMVIIEMPENCEDCPFNYDYIECTASKEYLKLKYEDFSRRNDKCPLRPADVEPVRYGRFIGTEYDGYADGNPVYYEWKCSECGCIFEDDEPTYNYCPNCGAKMDWGERK